LQNGIIAFFTIGIQHDKIPAHIQKIKAIKAIAALVVPGAGGALSSLSSTDTGIITAFEG